MVRNGDINFGVCKGCGQQIIWMRTASGKIMPVDPTLVDYVEVEGGKKRVVTPDGLVVAAETDNVKNGEGDGVGYISHFATCPAADRFRRR